LSLVDKSVSLELRLVAEKIGKRFTAASNLARTAWSPLLVKQPPGESFLVVAPHPDDDAIGCGGTVSRLVASGKRLAVTYLSIQSSSLFTREERMSEIESSLRALGVKDHSFLSERFPSKSELAGLLTKELRRVSPDSVFVPSPIENHDGHLLAFSAFLDALGSYPDAEVLLYEVWNPLVPNLLVDITDQMPRKIEAIEAHRTQTRECDFVKAAKGLNSYRAALSLVDGYAEAFLSLRKSELLRLAKV